MPRAAHAQPEVHSRSVGERGRRTGGNHRRCIGNERLDDAVCLTRKKSSSEYTQPQTQELRLRAATAELQERDSRVPGVGLSSAWRR